MSASISKGNLLGGSWISRFLDDVGDSTGEVNMNGNYTGPNTGDFKFTVPENSILYVYNLIITIEDQGSLDAGSYGNGVALTNGLQFGVLRRSGELEATTLQVPIKTNASWASYAHDLQVHDFGSGNNTLTVHYNFEREGIPIKIKSGQALVLRLSDDFSALKGHLCKFGGVLVPR
ncbi:MAG: hypothetical protein JRE23_13960 [Deltaproteobacteria bacterium]|nr:hypothetical protein [Deltaproteobacteria bacterium]